LIAGLRDLHVYALGGQPGAAPAADAPARSVGQELDALLSYGRLATLAGLAEAGDVLRRLLTRAPEDPPGPLLALLDRLTAIARDWIRALAAASHEARHRWYMVDLLLASMRGMIRDRVALDARGFDAINHHDFRDWLRLHGASELTLTSDQLRGGLYDLSFAYVDGDPGKPAFAAGDAMRGACRMFFTYRGSFFWKMRGGMGDVVFAPLYELLRRRGVRFRFFHRLENVQLSGDRSHVAGLEMSVQAELAQGEYHPLVEVAGMPCWPSEPDWAQLVGGDALRAAGWQPESFWDRRRAATRTLRVGEDFDLVVLGIGLGAVPHVCRELIAASPRWRAMTDNVTTVATQAFQLWLRADLNELGWCGPSPSLSGFDKPFDTWADMPHLIDVEAWRDPPQSIAYFCGALPSPPGTPDDPHHPIAQHERVRRHAVHFLDHQIHPLWPRAVRPGGGFRWELLADARRDGAPGDLPPAGPAGPERFATQFWTANVNPSDRYVQSMPGSSAYRISPLDATFDNLTIAGDWTACGLNVGCVEAAVMSGRLAAHAIAQAPALSEIVGYDHP
ncbi:MAG TPA: FAD-dependent oxidoreductase, partial [Kofleriaceae bacterium]|nr:FAD-dependent oxidoreductase [Kofleriaceae bacterium]